MSQVVKTIPCYRKNGFCPLFRMEGLKQPCHKDTTILGCCVFVTGEGEDKNVNYTLSVKKIAGSLSDAICNVSFPNGFLCHYRTEYWEHTASAWRGILFSIQIFSAWEKHRRDITEEYCPVLCENTGKYA